MIRQKKLAPELVLSDYIRQSAYLVSDIDEDYEHLMEVIGDVQFVLLGEASHGTHEFYQARAEITKRLIQDKGFQAVAVEADWPDAYRVNRYIRGQSDDSTPNDALSGFRRFPAWMWRNTDVADFVGWLRAYNDAHPQDSRKAGFYGLDLYSLHTSLEAVLNYLDKVDPEAANRARERYSCFEQFGEEPQEYGYATMFGTAEPCEKEVMRQLLELQQSAAEYVRRDGHQIAWVMRDGNYLARIFDGELEILKRR